MVERVRVVDLVADRLQVGAAAELVERQLVADAPVRDGEAVVGVPQHGVADHVVEGEHALLASDHRGVRPPGDPVLGLVDHHVGGREHVVLSRSLEVHMAPEVEQHRAVERLLGLLQERTSRLHAVVDRLLEPVHGVAAAVAGASGALPRIMSAAFSAIIIVAAFVFARVIVGITEASTTRSPSTP